MIYLDKEGSEEIVNTIVGVLTKVTSFWEKKRDRRFEKEDLNKDEFYDKGNFEDLPYDCAEAVHYVDAYKSMKENIEEIIEE